MRKLKETTAYSERLIPRTSV